MGTQNENVIEVVELTKVYKDFWGRGRVKALDSLSLTIQKGEVFGLLGPNGSGKTTAVRLILGLLFPTRGLVEVFGQSPRSVAIKARVGYMPEDSNLYSYLTAEETLHFFGRLFKLPRAERYRRVDSLIEMVGLEPARRRPVGEFSKGMARRIGLAQALINDPDLLILDEPTTGLDPIGSRQMKDLIKMLHGRGKTILACSHLLADVEATCDRVGILYGGKARAVGPVDELLVRQEMMQIRSPKVPPKVVEQIRRLIKENVAPDAAIEVGSPSQRLEEFFLDVVAQARREKLATAGAEAGGPAAAFLTGQDGGGVQLLDNLVAAAREAEAGGAQTAEAEPAAPSGGARIDESLLSGLVGSDAEPPAEADVEESAEAIPGSAGLVRHDLLDGLLDKDKAPDNGEADSREENS